MRHKNENMKEPGTYLVFARKFRPQAFDEVIGQEPITTTLKNAIAKGRIAHSFLFTGSRGIGKTSTARIFAKALNCERGPSPEPCNRCSICEEITQGTSLDVLEIDGASNRGIDEVRNLRESVKFKPARGRYKVYIIDEVHMLTGEAFNALLKTLEEPPEHVKFVFATTEVHKVPLTILSRCQRFNFRRIPTGEIAKKLKEVAKQEKIKVTDEVLYLISKRSEGSLRDAESLLDQLASFGEGTIEESDVTFSLGLTDRDVYMSLLDSLREKDAKKIVSLIAKITDQGKDLTQFAKGLLELFRDLMILAVDETGEKLIEGTADELKELKHFKGAFSEEELLFILTLLQQLNREIRWVETPRFLVETCLLKIANRADLKPIDEILKELKSLHQSNAVIPAKAGIQTRGSPIPATKIGGSAAHFGGKNFGDDSSPKVLAQKKKENSNVGVPSVGAQSMPPVTLSDVGRVWPELLERVKSAKMSCGTFLAEAEPVEVMDGIVVFGFPSEFKFHKEALENQSNKELIRSTLNALLGREVNVSFVVTEPLKNEATQKADPEALAKASDIITSALNLFEGSKVIRRDP